MRKRTIRGPRADREKISKFRLNRLKEIKLMLTQMAVTDTSEQKRLSIAELEASNRAYTWLMLKLALSAIALMSAVLVLMVLG
jgi:hypothetical protein